MSSKREQQRLLDIVENCEAVAEYINGMDFVAFAADRKTIDASERCLQRITEAVIKVGKDRMQQIAPIVPADAVRGLGNLLRHEYDRVDLHIIFATLAESLPQLRAACIAALKDLP
ncbi:DUF86 domain-containing protein [Sphingobium yanoikuyae]|uniref:HepT-like ribonuclease domain-containing protein n=1 Tax=Sphingobium yanoikuyae TaxID=13690 RepID=UPI0022DD762F|nr:HepT-like ribonuclease domain-containing protein [Sphingobium yanoikuyae]WBQ15644.1 DUF86 domain-containing protein [Sphingobium yanoikuyae]